MFILIGDSWKESTVYAEFTPKELKTFMVSISVTALNFRDPSLNLGPVSPLQKPSLQVLEKTDSVGWTMKAEMQSKSFLTKGGSNLQ